MSAEVYVLIEQQVKRCGGMIPVAPGVTYGLSSKDRVEIEMAQDARLPSEYAVFAANYGGHRFGCMVRFSTKAVDPLYKHPKWTGLPNKRVKGSMISHFYGSMDGDDPPVALTWAQNAYQSRIPSELLPIADDGQGNQICIACVGEMTGAIYFWDHDNEWDAEDYEDDTGEEMPQEAKFQNVYLAAESLGEFLKGLEVVPDPA